jgi:hypothetical protein
MRGHRVEDDCSARGFTPCLVCRALAHQDRHPQRYDSPLPGEAGARLVAENARLAFGLHLAQEHPAAVPVDPLPDDCHHCRELQLYLVVEGPDEEFPDLTGTVTGAEVARRHYLSHLIEHVPGDEPA